MRKIIAALVVLVLFASCQQDKIAYVDNSKLINEYQEKKDIEEKYKGKDEAYTRKRDSISQAFQIEYAEFQKNAQRLSPKKAQEESNLMNQKAQFLQQQLQIEQQQIGQAFQTEIDSLIVKVKDHVKDYGKINDYTYILGTSDGAASVLYGKEENDLTQTVLDELNKKYKEKE